MYGLTQISNNRKVGACATASAPRWTCPLSCPFRDGGGCYGEQWPLNCHWDKLTANERGFTWKEFLKQVELLPMRIWRYGDIGDLPGRGDKINARQALELAAANMGRPGFGYTHYPVVSKYAMHNQRVIQSMNEQGFTINISCEGLAKAGRVFTMEIGPVVTVVPRSMGDWRKAITPGGIPVLRCPAEYHKSGPKKTQCVTCGGSKEPLCARPYRPYIVGFTAHGNRAKLVERVIQRTEEAWS